MQVFCADCGTKLKEAADPSKQPALSPKTAKTAQRLCWIMILLAFLNVGLFTLWLREIDEVSYYSRQVDRYQELYEESKTEYEAAEYTMYFNTK